MEKHRQSLGRLGEETAVAYLKKRGYTVIGRNVRTRGGEIDIVCTKDSMYIFVEVKARIGDFKGKPYEAITPRKLKNLHRSILYYTTKHKINESSRRIDVVSIEFKKDRSVDRLQLFENVQ